jgi:hypothetical protein
MYIAYYNAGVEVADSKDWLLDKICRINSAKNFCIYFYLTVIKFFCLKLLAETDSQNINFRGRRRRRWQEEKEEEEGRKVKINYYPRAASIPGKASGLDPG